MNDITDKSDHEKYCIPDEQVKDVANQFFDAAKILWAKPPGSGVAVPAIVNSVLAVELYLKSLIAYSIIKDPIEFGGGVWGGKVTVELKKKVHKLTTIFDAIEKSTKKEFENKYTESSIFKPNSNYRDCLGLFDDAFVEVRYVFEDSTVFKGLNVDDLQQLMELTRTVIESLPENETNLKKT